MWLVGECCKTLHSTAACDAMSGTRSNCKRVCSCPCPLQVVLVPEVDGVRVVSNTRHELLRKVPQALSEVGGVGTRGWGMMGQPLW